MEDGVVLFQETKVIKTILAHEQSQTMTVTVNSIPHCNYKINFVNVSSGYESVMRPFLPQ